MYGALLKTARTSAGLLYPTSASFCGQGLVEFESAEEATRAVTQRDRQPLLPESSKRFVRLEQVCQCGPAAGLGWWVGWQKTF